MLNIPLVGFVSGTDERVTGTIDAVRGELGRGGLVSRYSTAETDDGLRGDEGQFLACSFWLVSALAHNGRSSDARALFERLLVGLPGTLDRFNSPDSALRLGSHAEFRVERFRETH